MLLTGYKAIEHARDHGLTLSKTAENGVGEQVTVEEALEIVKRGEYLITLET